MNVFFKMYCRVFQFCFKVALPILPYKDPKIIDSLENISNVLIEKNKSKPMIVTDKTISSLGLMNVLLESLKNNNIEYVIYDNVVANPTTDNCAEALKLYKDNNCDCLIAFGGGSPMDCAKGTGALVARPKKSLNKMSGILKVGKKIPLLIAVPTTAGTGSETTLAAVIVDSKTRHKYAIEDFPLIPKYACLDESVTMSLPAHIVSTTGMDALTHAIEAYIGNSTTRKTRKDSLEAIKLIFDNILVSYNEKTPESRKNMLIAAHKAGRAFSKSYVGYVHAIAHSLGGKYNTPHGLANAVILPYVLKEYGKYAQKKLKKIAVYLGYATKKDSKKDAAKIIIDKIEEYNKLMNIPTTIEGIKKDDIEGMVNYAYKEANPLYPVPKLWSKKTLAKMYMIVGGLND